MSSSDVHHEVFYRVYNNCFSINHDPVYVFLDTDPGTKYFSDREKRYKTTHKKEELVDMADAVITEFAGTRKGPVSRFYQYGREGIRVLDAGKNLQRLYLFGPSGMMTEHDPGNKEKILRRFIFDPNGMLE